MTYSYNSERYNHSIRNSCNSGKTTDLSTWLVLRESNTCIHTDVPTQTQRESIWLYTYFLTEQRKGNTTLSRAVFWGGGGGIKFQKTALKAYCIWETRKVIDERQSEKQFTCSKNLLNNFILLNSTHSHMYLDPNNDWQTFGKQK